MIHIFMYIFHMRKIIILFIVVVIIVLSQYLLNFKKYTIESNNWHLILEVPYKVQPSSLIDSVQNIDNLPGRLTWLSNKMAFIPESPLRIGETYRFKIDGVKAKKQNGESFGSDIYFSFTGAEDGSVIVRTE